MSDLPNELLYTASHEWVRREDDGTVVLGITDHAQQELGELVFVDLPAADSEVAKGDALAVIESTKAASDVYSPMAGEVTAVNTALDESPDLINQHPYGEGWILRLKPAAADWAEGLLSAEGYAKVLQD
jgi:glycine cleavage system H protein